MLQVRKLWLGKVSHLTDVTYLRSDSSKVWTQSRESHALPRTSLSTTTGFGELGCFYVDYPTLCLLTDQETEAG